MSRKKKSIKKGKSINVENAILFIGLLILGSLLLKNKISTIFIKETHTSSPASSVTNSPTPTEREMKTVELTQSPSMNVGTDKLKTYWTNKNLPGFGFWIPDGWNVQVKEFKDKDNIGFRTMYFPACHEQCMGIRLSKNGTQLEFIINKILDDNQSYCSTEKLIKHVRLSKTWFQIERFEDYLFTQFNPKYVYTQRLEYISRTTKNNDDKNVTQVESCVHGNMMGFKQSYSDYGLGLEHPKLYGDPSNDLLQEVWQIINSISGLR